MVTSDGVDNVEIVAELSASTSSTTPERLSLSLYVNVDYVRVQTYLTDIYGSPLSDCQEADIYRIGNAAVTWPVGGTYDLPLSYEQVLEPGLYVQEVRAYSEHRSFGMTHRGESYFEVTGDGMRPVDAGEYVQRLDSGLYDLALEPSVPPAIPCEEPLPRSDQVAPADATSMVDIDSWVNVSTMQPWRWVETECAPYLTPDRQSVEFRARNDAGQRLSLSITFEPEEPACAFETSGEWSFAPDGPTAQSSMSLVLEEPDGTRWEAFTAGDVRVERGQGEGAQLLVTLSDVVLEKNRLTTREPVVTRTMSTGSIRGRLINEVTLE